jgi:hypothetical protein
MKDLNTAALELELLVEERIDARVRLERMRNSGLSPAFEDELRGDLEARVAATERRIRRELLRFADFPTRHARHFERLPQFWTDGSFERSVFIMTKFPDAGAGDRGAELQRVIDTVERAISDAGFIPRIAQFPHNYHPGLWDNVELYLLGCRQGVAIVEDRYLPELNPNVAMEWGWMRGMGKRVLFLHEQGFGHRRADLGDLLGEPFEWDDPEPRVTEVVTAWLGTIARELTEL